MSYKHADPNRRHASEGRPVVSRHVTWIKGKGKRGWEDFVFLFFLIIICFISYFKLVHVAHHITQDVPHFSRWILL